MALFRRSAAKPATHPWEALLTAVYDEQGLPKDTEFAAQLASLPETRVLVCANNHATLFFGESPPIHCGECGRLFSEVDRASMTSTSALKRLIAAEAHRRHALSLTALGDQAAAEASLTKAIELDPNSESALHNRAEARFQLGDLGGALSDCDLVLRANPAATDTLVTRGGVRAQQGDYAGAIEDTTEALERGYERPIAFFNRGYCFALRGATGEARTDFERFLDLAPDDERAPTVRQLLREL